MHDGGVCGGRVLDSCCPEEGGVNGGGCWVNIFRGGELVGKTELDGELCLEFELTGEDAATGGPAIAVRVVEEGCGAAGGVDVAGAGGAAGGVEVAATGETADFVEEAGAVGLAFGVEVATAGGAADGVGVAAGRADFAFVVVEVSATAVVFFFFAVLFAVGVFVSFLFLFFSTGAINADVDVCREAAVKVDGVGIADDDPDGRFVYCFERNKYIFIYIG